MSHLSACFGKGSQHFKPCGPAFAEQTEGRWGGDLCHETRNGTGQLARELVLLCRVLHCGSLLLQRVSARKGEAGREGERKRGGGGRGSERAQPVRFFAASPLSYSRHPRLLTAPLRGGGSMVWGNHASRTCLEKLLPRPPRRLGISRTEREISRSINPRSIGSVLLESTATIGSSGSWYKTCSCGNLSWKTLSSKSDTIVEWPRQIMHVGSYSC